MALHLSSSVNGGNGPPDTQAEALRELARQQANANTWNMMQTGFLAAQAANQALMNQQIEEVRRQNENALTIQQELLNQEQFQQYLEEFIYQTEKLITEFSAKSDVPAPSRYFLLQSVLAQVEHDGINTATIRGRENKAAFEKAMACVRQLVATLHKDPEVQNAVEWEKKQEAKRAAERQKISAELDRLFEQRATIESQLNPLAFGEAAKQWFAVEKAKVPQVIRIPALILFAPVILFSVVAVLPALAFLAICGLAILDYQSKANTEANGPTEYQLSLIDSRITDLQSKLQ